MKVKHQFIMHAVCPFIHGATVWDYYDVSVSLEKIVDVHLIEQKVVSLCGARMSQEDLCVRLGELLSALCEGEVELRGKHSSNSHTVCSVLF